MNDLAPQVPLASPPDSAYRAIVKSSRPTTRVRLLATALAVPLLVQLLGLNVLCFCGHCPASQILLPAEPQEDVAEHACCHHADAADEGDETLPALAGQSCCGDDHVWRPATVITSDSHPPLPQLFVVALTTEQPLASAERLRVLPPAQQFLARGPPPVPIYLRHLSLRI